MPKMPVPCSERTAGIVFSLAAPVTSSSLEPTNIHETISSFAKVVCTYLDMLSNVYYLYIFEKIFSHIFSATPKSSTCHYSYLLSLPTSAFTALKTPRAPFAMA